MTTTESSEFQSIRRALKVCSLMLLTSNRKYILHRTPTVMLKKKVLIALRKIDLPCLLKRLYGSDINRRIRTFKSKEHYYTDIGTSI